jgi:hypothetical protein
MTAQTVDDVLRDLAKRGEISHISLVPSQNGKLWRASFSMCSKFGSSFAEDADPAKAIIIACTTANMKRRKVTSLEHVEAPAQEPSHDPEIEALM